MKQEYYFHFSNGQWWKISNKEMSELKQSFLHLYYEVGLSTSSLDDKQKGKLESMKDYDPLDDAIINSIVECNSNSSVLLKIEISDSIDQDKVKQLPIKLDIPQYLNDNSNHEELLNESEAKKMLDVIFERTQKTIEQLSLPGGFSDKKEVVENIDETEFIRDIEDIKEEWEQMAEHFPFLIDMIESYSNAGLGNNDAAVRNILKEYESLVKRKNYIGSETINIVEKIVDNIGNLSDELTNEANALLKTVRSNYGDISEAIGKIKNITVKEKINTGTKTGKMDKLLLSCELLDYITKTIKLQADILKSQNLPPDSPDVHDLIKDCQNINDQLNILRKRLQNSNKIHTEPSGTMQILVVKDKGIYKEIARETNKERFFSSVDFDNLVRDKKFSENYTGTQFLVFEIDQKEYLSVKGLKPEIIEKRSKLLTEKGQVKYSQNIVLEEKIAKKPQRPKLSKDQESLNHVAAKENRNVFDGIFDFMKMGLFIGKDIFIPRKEENPLEVKVPKKEFLQVIVMEKKDGTMTEVNVERNPNLFLLDNELDSFAENLKTTPGTTFRLFEIPVMDYPDVNQYLEKGIMTEEGKEKFQDAKNKCFQNLVKKGESMAVTTIVNNPVPKREGEKISKSVPKRSAKDLFSEEHDNKKTMKRKR